MKKRKILLGLALAAAAVFSLSACGDEEPAQEPGQIEPAGNTPSEVDKCKVSFYSNGGVAVDDIEVDKGGKITLPTTTRNGASRTYTLEGWYTDVALTQKFDANTEITESVTLYAKWTSAIQEVTAITMNGTTYETLEAAFAAIPATSKDTYTIVVPKGEYAVDAGLTYNGTATVKLVGNTDAQYGSDVVIIGRGSDMSAEKTRNLISIQGSGNIILENLTLKTNYSRKEAGNNAQAEVLGTDTKGNTVAYNCSFISNQDTLRTAGKAWFYGCYVEGDVDFLWMESAGSVALYEECEIVSVYDADAKTHNSYFTAPRMARSNKVGKGLVVYNSHLHESAEAKEKNQLTYMARNPWSNETTYFNQVAFIDDVIEDVEADIWYGSATATEYGANNVGWKMDAETAKSLNYTDSDHIVTDDVKANEFNGRRAILNRIFNAGKLKYEFDASTEWDIDSVIVDNGFAVTKDDSSNILDTDTAGEATVYKFDGSEDQSAICDGFAREGEKAHYKGGNGATITVPVSGKCFVEVYGYYAGTVEAKSDKQPEAVMFFNNNTTNSEVINTYAVYDATSSNVVITAKAQTYITKIVVVKDSVVNDTKVKGIDIKGSTENYCVGVALQLSATITNSDAINKSVKWSSNDPTKATIDQYSGKVTFLTAGEVTFTATACDGSGTTKTFTCTAIEANWNKAEWYTLDNKPGYDETVETTATEMNAFDINGSSYKALDAKVSFTDISGKALETSYGLKLNSSGKMVISTTKAYATLTIINYNNAGTDDSDPSVAINGKALTYVSKTTNGSTETFIFRLAEAGTYEITRGSVSKEIDPIIYVSCVYDAIWDFKNATPSNVTEVNIQGTNTGTVASNYTEKDKDVTLEVISEGGKFAYNSAGYVQINPGTTVRVPVYNVGSVLTVYAYPGQSKYTVGGVNGSTDIDEYTVTADDVERGYVEIACTSETGTGYINTITLSNPR